MNNENVKFGIDQITFVAQLNDKEKLEKDDWDIIAERIINSIADKLCLKLIFGKKEPIEKTLEGYTKGYTYGINPFYFCIAYHEAHWEMGVCVKFSAQSLACYISRYSEYFHKVILVPDIIRTLSETASSYSIRISRIDIYADIFNGTTTVNELCNDLSSNDYDIRFITGKKNPSKISYYTDAGVVNTIYIGSRKKNVTTLLRIYNKKKEQIDSHGYRFDEAVTVDSWVRIEDEIKGQYAHDLTGTLVNITSAEELIALIRTCILNKYQIVNVLTDEDHPITKALKESGTSSDYYYSPNHYKDMSLSRSLDYLMKNSGLSSFVYRICSIKPDCMPLLMNYIEAYMRDNYKVSKDTAKWLQENKDYYTPEDIEELLEPDSISKEEAEDVDKEDR